MSTKIFEGLTAWSKGAGPKQQIRLRAGALWKRLHPKHDWIAHIGLDMDAKTRKVATSVASCLLLRFNGAGAECEVCLGDFEMPNVSLPAWVLRANNLREGDRFRWIMRDTDQLRAADIETGIACAPASAQLLAPDQIELTELLADSRRREQEGEVWEEFTGDGR